MVQERSQLVTNVSGRGVSATRHRPLRSHRSYQKCNIIIVCIENKRTMVLQRRKFHHGCRVIAEGNITMNDPQNGI
jgi:hypothetical protein